MPGPNDVHSAQQATAETTSHDGDGATPGSTLRTRANRRVETRTTHRRLMLHGFAAHEAAQLTAFIAGIDVAHTWSLQEINRLLFMRVLRGSDESLS